MIYLQCRAFYINWKRRGCKKETQIPPAYQGNLLPIVATPYKGMMISSNGNISALLALCVGNSPVTSEFPSQRPVMRSFDVFFDLRLNKPLGKQSWGWWFETSSRSLWRHCNGFRVLLHIKWFALQLIRVHYIQYIPRNMHTVLLCFALLWLCNRS